MSSAPNISNPPNRKKHLLVGTWAAALLACHLGISEYLSVQFLAFTTLAIYSILHPGTYQKIAASIAIIAAINLFAPIAAGHDSHYLLKAARSAATMILIAFFWRHTSSPNNKLLTLDEIEKILFIVTITNFCLGCAQLIDSVTSNRGFFDVPTYWFSLDYGTLLADHRSTLSQAGYFIRPSGTFSEPSALAFSSLISYYCGRLARSRRLISTSIGCIAISLSLSGVFFLIVLYLLTSSDIRPRKFLSPSSLIKGILAATLLIGLAAIFQDRLFEIFAGQDASANIRVLEPLRLLQAMIANGDFFGMTIETLEKRMSYDVDRAVDTWPILQILLFGLGGLILIFCIPVLYRPKLGWLILTLSPINGDAFYYDRVIYFIIAAIAIRKFTNQKEIRHQ